MQSTGTSRHENVRLGYTDSTPVIVYVFPLPVWPYAKTVALKPSRAESRSDLTPAKLCMFALV
eukprot:SAG31_NODE_940_length_10870_cov_12.600501_11_plen_63_part_00